MKIFLLTAFIIITLFSCSKPDKPTTNTSPQTNIPDTPTVVDTPIVSSDTFTTYRILKGKNYCENNSYTPFKQSSLRFKAIFDSSCIYKNVDTINQADINKLYGFSDCSTLHHANSARFGWNWMDGEIHIHAYCYADSVRSYKEIGTVKLNEEAEYSLKVLDDKYIFALNGKEQIMTRHCTDTIAYGIKLLPYFGGDEPAPQDIKIRIKELK